MTSLAPIRKSVVLFRFVSGVTVREKLPLRLTKLLILRDSIPTISTRFAVGKLLRLAGAPVAEAALLIIAAVTPELASTLKSETPNVTPALGKPFRVSVPPDALKAKAVGVVVLPGTTNNTRLAPVMLRLVVDVPKVALVMLAVTNISGVPPVGVKSANSKLPVRATTF